MIYKLSIMQDCQEFEACDEADQRKVNWNNPVLGGELPELIEWAPPRLTRLEGGDGTIKARRLCDLSAVANSFLLSQHAVEALGPILADDALLYPVIALDCETEFFMLIPRFTIDCLDRDKSEGDIRKYGPLAGYFSAIRKLVVDETRLNGRNVFMLPDSKMACYVTEEFKNAVWDTKLCGFELRQSHWDTSPWTSG